MHSFDQALRLEPAGADRPDTWLGHSSPEYWNMVGPFGGTTAATALRAILLHPALRGEPVALTVNYAAAMAEGPFSVTARPARTNRSTQHWMVEMLQGDEVVATATAVTAVRRETWGGHEARMPEVHVVVDGDAADIHAHLVRPEADERLLRPAERVEDFQVSDCEAAGVSLESNPS